MKIVGQWKGQMRHGYGIQVWPDGARYEGYWQDNKAHGKGKFYHVEGDVYDGDWVEDKVRLKRRQSNRHMDTECTYIQTEHDTKETGKMIFKMGMELRFGKIKASTKVTIRKV